MVKWFGIAWVLVTLAIAYAFAWRRFAPDFKAQHGERRGGGRLVLFLLFPIEYVFVGGLAAAKRRASRRRGAAENPPPPKQPA